MGSAKVLRFCAKMLCVDFFMVLKPIILFFRADDFTAALFRVTLI